LTYSQWLAALKALTDTRDAARLWRERRFEFAYRLGEELAGPRGNQSAVHGSVVYGIWLSWGLLYVGQTTEASRRLRDLPIGESHHLANTFPPEIWDRVVIVNWPSLHSAEVGLKEADHKLVGLALEHRLQLRLRPLVNSYRRTSAGGWRSTDWGRSNSRGARSAANLGELGQRVDALWDAASTHEAGDPELPASVRCIRPGTLLKADGSN
jgi:hypothetical protein